MRIAVCFVKTTLYVISDTVLRVLDQIVFRGYSSTKNLLFPILTFFYTWKISNFFIFKKLIALQVKCCVSDVKNTFLQYISGQISVVVSSQRN